MFAIFASAAAGQLALAGAPLRTQLTIAIIACAAGLTLVAVGALLPQIVLFLGGGVVAGLGVGVLFRGAIGTAVAIAEPGHAGETLALLFLIAYAGPVIPVLAVGIGADVRARRRGAAGVRRRGAGGDGRGGLDHAPPRRRVRS